MYLQNIYIMLICCIAKDVMSLLISQHKHYDFNAAIFFTLKQMKIGVTDVKHDKLQNTFLTVIK